MPDEFDDYSTLVINLNTNKIFSKIALDHNHKQVSAKVKRVLEELDKVEVRKNMEEHHDLGLKPQIKFQQDIRNLRRFFLNKVIHLHIVKRRIKNRI